MEENIPMTTETVTAESVPADQATDVSITMEELREVVKALEIGTYPLKEMAAIQYLHSRLNKFVITYFANQAVQQAAASEVPVEPVVEAPVEPAPKKKVTRKK